MNHEEFHSMLNGVGNTFQTTSTVSCTNITVSDAIGRDPNVVPQFVLILDIGSRAPDDLLFTDLSNPGSEKFKTSFNTRVKKT